MIRAITFDLWDTIIDDDSDEAKRSARGLPSKAEARRDLVWRALAEHEPLERGSLALAYDVAESAFNHVWHRQHVTWSVQERLRVLLAGLRRSLPEAQLAALVRRLEEMELEVMPDPVDGVAEALESLASRFALAVVSDAIYTPGRCLRIWLERQGLCGYFRAFAFSDEIGRSKPHRDMFERVAADLDVELHEMLHVGDRDHNDVRGPQALGMKAVLFTGARDADRARTSADAVCDRHRDLPAVVARLAGG